LRHVAGRDEAARLAAEREAAFPKPLFLAGKALNALLLDHTEVDLDRMERLNDLIVAGTAAFGPGFTDAINAELGRIDAPPIRRIDAFHVRPSVDIGAL